MEPARIKLPELKKLCISRGASERSAGLASVACDLAGGAVDFHPAGLRVKKGFQARAPLVVDGNLDVDGCFEDCVGLDHNIVIVTGDLRCRGLISNATTLVLGSVRINGDAWLMSLGNNTLHIRKDLHAGVVASEGHWLNLAGKLRVRALVGNVQAPSGRVMRISFKHQVLHPSLFKRSCSDGDAKKMELDEIDDCCTLKEREIVSWIRKGKSLTGKK